MRTVNLNLVINKEDKPVIWESSKTINIVYHINAYFTINEEKIDMELKSFIDMVKKFGYEKDFEEQMKKIFIELDNDLLNYKNKDNKKIADPIQMYYSDINISYYKNGYFSIVIARESARGNLLKTWENNLEKIWLGKY